MKKNFSSVNILQIAEVTGEEIKGLMIAEWYATHMQQQERQERTDSSSESNDEIAAPKIIHTQLSSCSEDQPLTSFFTSISPLSPRIFNREYKLLLCSP